MIARLRRMIAYAKEQDVILLHENEKDIYGDVAERVKDVLDSVPALKSIYDPANYLQVGEKAEHTLDLFHARTDYFHIKDVIVSTGELVPAGYGDGMLDELVKRIDKDIVLSIEPHLAIFAAYAQIDGTEMKHKFEFHSNNEAFDAAVAAIKNVLKNAGYQEINGEFIGEKL